MTASQLDAFTAHCGTCSARVPIPDLDRRGSTSFCRDPLGCAFRARLRTADTVWQGLRGLTVWQPWAFAIALGKSPENRGRNLTYRGAVAIHAGLEVDDCILLGEADETRARVWDHFLGLGAYFALWNARTHAAPAGYPLMARGAVIAVAQLYGTHRVGELDDACGRTAGACSPWAAMSPGAWHWQLRGVIPLDRPVATRGYQHPWELPGDVTAAIRRQIVRTAV